MATVRSLLVRGNDKLSEGIWHFDLPASRTCPGKSRLCDEKCYAQKSRFLFPQVIDRLAWNYEQSKLSTFAESLADELYRKGVLLMRWHCAGDVYSPTYARKMLEVMGRSAHTQFWFYTRSWRVEPIFPLLKAISFLSNCKVWFSADCETGYPPEVPENVRVAWMATEEGEDVEQSDLIFLDRPLRSLPLTVIGTVCPTELPEGKKKGTTCATCRLCWK